MTGIAERVAIAEGGIRVAESPRCLLCGRPGKWLYRGLRDRMFDVPGTWSLMACPRRHLAWLNPRPIAEDLPRLYERYFTHGTAGAPEPPHRSGGIRDGEAVAGHDRAAEPPGPLGAAVDPALGPSAASRYGRTSRVPRLMKSALRLGIAWIGLAREAEALRTMTLGEVPAGRLLDVGCGDGRFLAAMRAAGWQVRGVEPDARAARAARERLGIAVHAGTLESAELPAASFDAIAMSHVIEHVSDPVATLRECRRLLAPGGRLVAITPNLASLGRRRFGPAFIHLDPPRHLHLFSAGGLRACAQQAGLAVARCRTTAREARGAWAESRLIRRHGVLPEGSPDKRRLALRVRALGFELLEHALCRVLDVGEEIVLIATAMPGAPTSPPGAMVPRPDVATAPGGGVRPPSGSGAMRELEERR
jgi:SAM-dependent methyltransferase